MLLISILRKLAIHLLQHLEEHQLYHLGTCLTPASALGRAPALSSGNMPYTCFSIGQSTSFIIWELALHLLQDWAEHQLYRLRAGLTSASAFGRADASFIN